MSVSNHDDVIEPDSAEDCAGVDVKKYLMDRGIEFNVFEHKAVFTCDEARDEKIQARGIHSKNLFLKDKKSRSFYLVVAPADLKLNMKELGEVLGEKLKFANVNDLENVLKLTPGSVSPFGLLNDKHNVVKLILHKKIIESEYVSFHPNINTLTMEIKQSQFEKCLHLFGNQFDTLDF